MGEKLYRVYYKAYVDVAATDEEGAVERALEEDLTPDSKELIDVEKLEE